MDGGVTEYCATVSERTPSTNGMGDLGYVTHDGYGKTPAEAVQNAINAINTKGE